MSAPPANRNRPLEKVPRPGYDRFMSIFRRTKPFLTALALCAVWGVLSAGVFYQDGLEHGHHGGNCSVCLLLQIAENILKAGTAGLAAVFFAAAPRRVFSPGKIVSRESFPTLVSLKARSNR